MTTEAIYWGEGTIGKHMEHEYPSFFPRDTRPHTYIKLDAGLVFWSEGDYDAVPLKNIDPDRAHENFLLAVEIFHKICPNSISYSSEKNKA